jgi:anti-sigma B factor antagonist
MDFGGRAELRNFLSPYQYGALRNKSNRRFGYRLLAPGGIMNISTETREGHSILLLKDERLDASNSGELRDIILGLLRAEGQRLIMDLSAVSFIDSSGLGTLLNSRKDAYHCSSSIALTGLQPRVQSMLELTRLNQIFDIFPTLEDAIAKR